MSEARYYIHLSSLIIRAPKSFHMLRSDMGYDEAERMFWRYQREFENSYLTLCNQDTGTSIYLPHEDRPPDPSR